MSNRATRRRQKKNGSRQSNIGAMSNFLDTKNIDRMADDKMIWVAMGLIGIAVLVVIAYVIYLGLRV